MPDILEEAYLYNIAEQPVNLALESPRVTNSEEENEHAIYIAYIILVLIMIVYVTVGTWMEKNGCGFGHETGVVIIIGMSIGGILHLFGDNIATEFKPTVLFDFGLPFILYSAGYNMRRRRFFDDINNITMFGILSTVVCFVVLSLLTTLIFQAGWIYKYETEEADGSW